MLSLLPLLLLVTLLLLLLDVVAPIFSSISTSMLTNSVESDFLYLRYSPFSSATNATKPGGVYALGAFESGQIICQPRGFLIPVENASHFTTNNILTYDMITPLQEGLNNENSSANAGHRQRYILVDNTICSRIRFCFPSPVGVKGVGSCGNALLTIMAATGFMIVKAINTIPAGTEIIVELHLHYNLHRDHFNEQCHFDPHGCGIASDGLSTPKEYGVISSESFALYLGPSSIPGVGLGVFTKFAIPPYHIISLCQGKVYHYLYHNDAEKMDRLTAAQGTPSGPVVIQMDNFCGYTNDIIDISFMNNSYTEEDMKGSVPRLPEDQGYAYNSVQAGAEYRVSAIIATKHIPAHTEVFQPYGDSYWWYRYKKRRTELQKDMEQLEEQEA